MKKAIFFITFSLFLVNYMFSQMLTITFADYTTKTPLANILLTSNSKPIGISDNRGTVIVDKSLIVDNKIKPFSYLYATDEISLLDSDNKIKIELLQFEEIKTEIKDIPAFFAPIMKLARKSPNFTANYRVDQFGEYNIFQEPRKFVRKEFKNDIILTFKKKFTVKSNDGVIGDTAKNIFEQTYLCDIIRNNTEEIFTQPDKYIFQINRIVKNDDLGCDVYDISIRSNDVTEKSIVANLLLTSGKVLQFYKEILRTNAQVHIPKSIFIYSNTKNEIPLYIETYQILSDDTQRVISSNKLYLK